MVESSRVRLNGGVAEDADWRCACSQERLRRPDFGAWKAPGVGAHPARRIGGLGILVSPEPQQDEPHVADARLLELLVDKSVVELVLLRLQELPGDRSDHRVDV